MKTALGVSTLHNRSLYAPLKALGHDVTIHKEHQSSAIEHDMSSHTPLKFSYHSVTPLSSLVPENSGGNRLERSRGV